MLKALDACIDVAAYAAKIKAAGYATVIRYFDPGWANMSHYEADVLRSHGLGVGFVYEESSGWVGGGRAAGVRAASFAHGHWPTIGCTDPVTLYLANDTDTNSDSSVLSALEGAASVIGHERVGLYGGRQAIEAAQRHGGYRLWQTIAWSYGHIVPGIDLFQHLPSRTLGFDMDHDDQYKPDVGQWGAPAAVVPYGALKRTAIVLAEKFKFEHAGITTDNASLGPQARALLLHIQQNCPTLPPRGVDYRPLKHSLMAVAVRIGAGHRGLSDAVNVLGPGAKAALGNVARHK